MISILVTRMVDAARRHAAPLALILAALAIGSAYFAATHLRIDTDVARMLPADLPWKQNELALDRAFPQNADPLAIVVDGQTPELADRAASLLADRLRREPQLFKYVRRPDGGDFFNQNGLLFLPLHEVQQTAERLISAQPLIGGLAHDPSLRGLFGVMGTFLQGAQKAGVPIDRINPSLTAIDHTVRQVLQGQPAHLSWQQLFTAAPQTGRDLRRFVLTQPVLDYSALQPGGRATAEVRRLTHALALDPAHGVNVRLTGSVALNDEQFVTLRDGAVVSILLSIAAVCAILFLALRSVKLVLAILATVAAGLVLTAGFAAVAIGSVNLISVAFAVLFVGLATDFAIQFAVRYRDQRYHRGDFAAALKGTAASLHGALLLAAAATAIGFLAFLPTDYVGISELGLIAGVGMIIGIALTFSLLPALLALLRPRGEPEPIGFVRAAPLDRLLLRRRRWVIGAAALLAAGGLALLPMLRFDFDPLDLQNQNTEAMRTLRSMMQDPTTSPYAAEALAPSPEAAQALAERFAKLPEAGTVITLTSFIPDDQKAKLAQISDLAFLLGPSLSPLSVLPPPHPADELKAIAECRAALEPFAAKEGPTSPAARLAQALGAVEQRGAALLPELRQALIAGLPHQLDQLRALIAAKPVTLATLPPELKRSWMAPDGRTRVEVFPRGNPRDRTVLRNFVAALRQVAPNVTGTPVTIQESGRTITGAFAEAGAIAVVAIIALLAVVLRRARDVALVLAPLLLAGILTLAATVVLGMPLNYANIIALPLLLGIGVAFDIYFVMNWRAGQSEHLQSSTARAVIFSALTTAAAFGSLALSPQPGTAAMGKLLAISLFATLFCTMVILPALLGPASAGRRAPERAVEETVIAPPRERARQDREAVGGSD
ncbi:MAG TPA: MMPL family transporter [Stellaceae bacterium]|nr:MMPL family transporter [Stellaceae bacterium]